MSCFPEPNNNKLRSNHAIEMEGPEMRRCWFQKVTYGSGLGGKKVNMSQMDTYLLEMVSFQIIKKCEVQLAVTGSITATVHRLRKRGETNVSTVSKTRE